MPSIFDELTQEQLAAVLRGQSLADEGSMLDAQLAQLLGSDSQHAQYSSPLGAGLGGLADAIDDISGAYHAKALRGQRADNLKQQDALMADFAKLLKSKAEAAPAESLGLHAPAAARAPGVLASHRVPQSMQGHDITPEWGLDLSTPSNQPADPTALTDGWGVDFSAPQPNQPANPTELQPGWGVDLSAPAVPPSLADASGAMPGDVLPDMTQLPRRRQGRRPTLFTF